ncbi:MAG: DUF1269 domain-containing protein [Gammaproteobacteria bacterium]|nr:DUF1269 domain-containing protein [Gammaproteobacteria bacterium]
MSKLYFLIPNTTLAEEIVRDLRARGLVDEDISVVGNAAALRESLPEPDVSETSDIKPALKQGAAIGGATGLLAGLAATVIPGGFAVGGAALLGMTLGGSAFGAWASSLIGISVPNREVKQFQRAIKAGELLMIVNPGELPVEQVKAIVSGRHPEVGYGGMEGEVRTVA